MTLNWVIFVGSFLALSSLAEYVPGTPGSVWTKEETEIVRRKVIELMRYSNWSPDTRDGLFWTDGTLDGSRGISWVEDKWCKDCAWGKKDIDKNQMPNTAKLLRLAFHDCAPYLAEDGSTYGGCDGCINWKGMGFGYSGFPGGTDYLVKDYYPEDKLTFGNNNGLQTTAAALELIYTDPAWPSNVPALAVSLRESGKSRADLWQYAANIALESEIERANFGCDYDFNTGNQVRLLEDADKCFFKLFKPSVFKFGRKDCVPDEAKKVTEFPYEATDTESHPNNYGTAKHVVDSLQSDFGLTARQGVSLMAVHATAGQQHNFRLPTKYMWPGNPYLSNMYFKYLAGVGMYRRYKGLKPRNVVSIGDHSGGPNMGGAFKLRCGQFWKSNQTANGWGGPCFWRPTNSGCNRPGEERSKNCFERFDEDGNIVLKSGNKDKNGLCQNTVYDEDRVQSYLDERESNVGSQGCGTELTFALTYEVNMMYGFDVDDEFRPVGCAGALEKMWFPEKNSDDAKSLTTESCPLNMEAYEDGETLSEITRSFGEDHDVWNKAFMEGWEKFVENGYKEGELVSGPEYSWLGYFKQGSFDGASYPLVFTDNLKADPTVTSLNRMTFRKECVRGLTSVPQPTECPPSFRTAHEDYYISRLESPWACDEEGSTLDTIPINIVNSKDGKMMGMNSETGAAEVSSDNTLWTFRPSCDGGVELTNIGTGAIITTWTHDPEKMTFMDQETGKFAISTKKKGLKWMDVQYLKDWPWSNTPWGRYRWEIKRASL